MMRGEVEDGKKNEELILLQVLNRNEKKWFSSSSSSALLFDLIPSWVVLGWCNFLSILLSLGANVMFPSHVAEMFASSSSPSSSSIKLSQRNMNEIKGPLNHQPLVLFLELHEDPSCLPSVPLSGLLSILPLFSSFHQPPSPHVIQLLLLLVLVCYCLL